MYLYTCDVKILLDIDKSCVATIFELHQKHKESKRKEMIFIKRVTECWVGGDKNAVITFLNSLFKSEDLVKVHKEFN